MAKFLALGAYFYQAVLAFGLLLVVARLLPPSDYAGYSIFIAATQFVAIGFFDWLRFASTRFYPGTTPESEISQRATLRFEAMIAALVCALAGAIATLFGLPPLIALLGVVTVICQGAGDVHLSVLRFRRQFAEFSMLQGVRASLLAIATIGGAWLMPSLLGAATGLVSAYLIYSVLAFIIERSAGLARGHWDASIARAHLSYGSASAGAAVLGLSAPLGLRLILSTTLGAPAAAGALLAVDLLQKPFWLMISALQAVQYPDVVSAFDGGERANLKQHLGQYYALLVTLTLLTGAGIFAILPLVAEFAVGAELRQAFLAAAPLLILLFLPRNLTQSVSITPAHLEKNLKLIVLLALADVVGLNVLALLFANLFGSGSAIIFGAALGTVLAGLLGLRVLMSLPFSVLAVPILAGLAALLTSGLLFFFPVGAALSASLVSIGVSGLISLGALYALYRRMGWGQSAPQ